MFLATAIFANGLQQQRECNSMTAAVAWLLQLAEDADQSSDDRKKLSATTVTTGRRE